MNNQALKRFERSLIQNTYAYNQPGFVLSCLSSCLHISCQDKKKEFQNNLSSWITQNYQIEAAISTFLEIRLFNYLKGLNAEFVQTSSVETADIEIKVPDMVFEIECTHSLRKTMKLFDDKTTLRIDNPFNEKEGKRRKDEAVGLVDPFYAHWSIRKSLGRKAIKKLRKPFIIYFWYPTNGFSLGSDDFNDILNIPYQQEITSDRSEWNKIDGLLKALEKSVNLKDFKEANKDLDDSTRKQFYSFINQERIIQEQKNHDIFMSIGGNVDLYRKERPTDNNIREYLTNSLIVTYMIQKSKNLIGLLIDHSKLDEKPNLQFIEKSGNQNEFAKIEQNLQNLKLLKYKTIRK